ALMLRIRKAAHRFTASPLMLSEAEEELAGFIESEIALALARLTAEQEGDTARLEPPTEIANRVLVAASENDYDKIDNSDLRILALYCLAARATEGGIK